MATLTVNGVEDALLEICGSKGANSAQFLKELNMALPRLYNMGLWRDLVFERTISTTDGTFTLPDYAESIVSALVDNDPEKVRAQFHDYRIVGRNEDGNTLEAFGIVDDGYAPTINELTTSDDYTGYQLNVYPVFPNVALPSVSGSANIVVEYDVLAGSATSDVSLSGAVVSGVGSGLDIQNVTEIRVGGDDLTAEVDVVAIPRGYTTDPTLTLSGTTISQTGTVITIPVTDASDVVVGDIISLTGWPVSSPGSINPLGEYRVTGVDTDDDKIYLYRSTDSETWTADGDSKIIHYPVLKLATVREPNYVARFRRFRIANSNNQKVTMRLLLKRKFKKLLDSNDRVYPSSLNAIKHAMLGNTAEDNADLERANYHWGVCRAILDEQLDAHRGSARPTVKVDPSGVGSYTSNMM